VQGRPRYGPAVVTASAVQARGTGEHQLLPIGAAPAARHCVGSTQVALPGSSSKGAAATQAWHTGGRLATGTMHDAQAEELRQLHGMWLKTLGSVTEPLAHRKSLRWMQARKPGAGSTARLPDWRQAWAVRHWSELRP
jgi:hypothetical protein